MWNRIDNITDQLGGFVQEVESEIENLTKKGYSVDEAIKIVSLGIEAIKAEVEHHKDESLISISESLEGKVYDM